MNLIHNKGFRIFLYIFGYISAAAVIALSLLTFLRYTTFYTDIGTAENYAEVSYIKYIVYNQLYNQQAAAKSTSQWAASGLEDGKLNLYDYSTGERADVLLKDLPEAANYTGVLEALKSASYNWNITQTTDLPYEGAESILPLNVENRFLKIRTEDYIRLFVDRAEIFSEEKRDLYFNDPTSLTEKERLIYSQLYRYNWGDSLIEGDYFLILNSGMLSFSPAQMSITHAGRDFWCVYLDSLQDTPVYITLSEDLAKKKDLASDESSDTAVSILSGSVYTSPFEAFFASLTNEQQDLILNLRNESNGRISNANLAYSFGNDEIASSSLYDPRGILNGASEYMGSYAELCGLIEQTSDVYVRYDSDSGKLEQWYKDPAGEIHPYEYVADTELRELKAVSDESFVLGLHLYDNDYNSIALDSLAFSACKAIPSPVPFLIISILVFVLCVVLILIGVGKRQLAIDRIPFEIFLAGYLMLLFVFGYLIPHEVGTMSYPVLNLSTLAVIALAVILALYILTAGLFTTITRRIKGETFVKTLLVVQIAKLLSKGIRRTADAYEKSLSGHKRLIIFASVLFAVNALALLLLGLFIDGPGVILCLLLIVAEAFAGYHLLKYTAGVERVLEVSKRIEDGELDAKADPDELNYNIKELGESLNNIGDGLSKAVESSIRDERTKAELITNVSHDIKTPLTSIISYVDLLKKEPAGSEKAAEYIDVLDKKSQRLKQLIMDLIEVSKTGTGNIDLDCMNLNITELLDQALGEYEEKMAACGLEPVKTVSAENTVIYADGRRVFRIIDNLFNNVVKYAQPGTRVYIDLTEKEAAGRKQIALAIKNISREKLNISAEELTERFVRGDRSRHTEGSGLGLSIARNLTELQGGTFGITIDGDLFKAEVTFPTAAR